MSIVNIVRAACRSIDMDRDPRIAVDALQAAYDILNEVAGELQLMAEEHEGACVALREVRT